MSSAADRLGRLLALVPYLLAHPGVSVKSAAAQFQVSQATLLDDLQLLFVCGLPGHLPDDLIDVSVDGGLIHLSNADTIARPLRLTRNEALALLMGLSVLVSQTPGKAQPVVQNLLAKVSAAAGLGEQGPLAAPAVTLVQEEQAPLLDTINQAMAKQRQLRIDYHSPRRDSISTRLIDPLSLEMIEGRYYVQAWCHHAQAWRVFRTDRIVQAQLSELPRQLPEHTTVQPLPSTVFTHSSADVQVVCDISEQATWMINYYAAQVVEGASPGRTRIQLRTPDTDWVVHLALRLAQQVQIVHPQWLAQQVRSQAEKGIAAQQAVLAQTGAG